MAQVMVFRFDPEMDEKGYFDQFTVPVQPGMTALEALFHILEREDGSLAFRYACRGAVCGSCAMHINGRYRLACATQMTELGEEVVIRPLYHLPVVRDLVVDMRPFFEKYERIRPWLTNEELVGDHELRQSPAERARLDGLIECILCACCHSACPFTQTAPEYLGPALLLKAARFHEDSRDQAPSARLAVAGGEDGVWRCHTAMNCAEVCPKELNPTEAIALLKRGILKQWRPGKAR